MLCLLCLHFPLWIQFLGLQSEKKQNNEKLIPAALEMDGIGKEFEANRAILDADIQDQEQWAQNHGEGVHARASNPRI